MFKHVVFNHDIFRKEKQDRNESAKVEFDSDTMNAKDKIADIHNKEQDCNYETKDVHGRIFPFL